MTSLSQMRIVTPGPERDRYLPLFYVADDSTAEIQSCYQLEALAFYQRAGFRMWKLERDFFSPARGYPIGLEENGIPVRDMLWLDQDLSRSSKS